MINRESLARFAAEAQPVETKHDVGFDMGSYLAKHKFGLIRCKPWHSNPGGFIYELELCPFNPDHTGGSAAFTIINGKPGFRCQHDGCRGKTIKDVFALYPADSVAKSQSGISEDKPRVAQSQLLLECAADAQLFHTPDGEAYASLSVGDHREVWPLKRNRSRYGASSYSTS
jgi:hypothetical protein